jgi:hypothetical protein
MGKNFKDIIKAKFRKGLISIKEVGEGIRHQWSRHNFDIGESRKEKKEKQDKIFNKELKREIDEQQGVE